MGAGEPAGLDAGETAGLGAGVWPTGVGSGGQSEPGDFFKVTVMLAAPDLIVVEA